MLLTTTLMQSLQIKSKGCTSLISSEMSILELLFLASCVASVSLSLVYNNLEERSLAILNLTCNNPDLSDDTIRQLNLCGAAYKIMVSFS